MKREKVFAFLWSCLLSFMIAFAGIACLVTAFRLNVDLGQVVWWCAASSVVCSLCFTLPLGAVPGAAGALLCGYLWRNGSLELTVEALLYRLSWQYNKAYGWGLIRWTMRTADDMEPTLGLSLCLIGALIAMVTAWTVCRRKPVIISIAAGAIPLAACLVVTDTIPKEIWLYCLLLGIVVLLLTGSVRRQSAAQGNRACAFVIGPAALALLLLFLLVPQKSYTGQANARALADAFLRLEPIQTLVGRFADASVIGTTVDGSGVDLTQAGVRIESKAEIMQVTAEYTGTLYLRGRGLDAYDGLSWRNSGTNTDVLDWPTKGMVNGGEVKIVTRYAHRMLYVPYYSRGTQIKNMSVGIENEKRLTQYSYPWSVADEEYVKTLPPGNASHFVDGGITYSERHTHLTDEVRSWAEPLAQRLTQGVDGDQTKALIIGNYVRSSAKYDTNTHAMPKNQKDFAKWFLEESETGYCVHFATAATVLLQAAGIPARYVTGYTAKVIEGRTTVVEARQAHAWVEYWLAGYGWVILEATPAAPAPVPETEPQTEELTKPSETPDKPSQSVPEQTAPDSTEQPKPQTVDLRPLMWALAAVAVAGVIYGQRRLRLWLKKRQLSRGSRNRQALVQWGETVRFARYLGQQPSAELFQLAQKARFSQHILTEEEIASFDRELDSARSRLKQRSVFHQIYYRLILVLY